MLRQVAAYDAHTSLSNPQLSFMLFNKLLNFGNHGPSSHVRDVNGREQLSEQLSTVVPSCIFVVQYCLLYLPKLHK